MSSTARVVLKPRKLTPFLHRHPWVLDSAIARIHGRPADGEEVDLVADGGQWVARGLFNSRSRIRVRLYSWTPGEALSDPFWRSRLETAFALRLALGYDDPQGACRLVFSEADGLSGLIVDRFAGHLVVQPTALGTALRLPMLTAVLRELADPLSISVRTDTAIATREGIDVPPGVIHGAIPPEPIEIREHGLWYAVQLGGGQKTGFYLDQRENRRRAADFLRGGRILDMCCYSGGFGLAALRLGQAVDVVGVDTSAAAVEVARGNAGRNGITGARFETGDCFRWLEDCAATGPRFTGVVLDPPKFARSRSQVPEALRAYHRLNRLAIQLLEPNGILVTCSCSGSVLPEDFANMLLGVATKTGRSIQVLEQRGAAPDHPLNLACPETDYLKCFICRVQ